MLGLGPIVGGQVQAALAQIGLARGQVLQPPQGGAGQRTRLGQLPCGGQGLHGPLALGQRQFGQALGFGGLPARQGVQGGQQRGQALIHRRLPRPREQGRMV